MFQFRVCTAEPLLEQILRLFSDSERSCLPGFCQAVAVVLTDVPVSLCFKQMVVPFNSGPQCRWGCDASWKDYLWTIRVPQERERMLTSIMKYYFPSLTLSNLLKKYEAILCNGSGQPAPALKLRTAAQDKLLEVVGTVSLYIPHAKNILPQAVWRWKAVTHVEHGKVQKTTTEAELVTFLFE